MHLQCTLIVIVSNRGISVAELAASHRYLASLSVTFVKICISAVTDLSVVFTVDGYLKKERFISLNLNNHLMSPEINYLFIILVPCERR